MRVALMFTLVAALSGLAACSKKAENIESTDVPEQATNVEPPITQEQAVSAMLRGHPNSRRVCVDSYREQAFFVDYGPPLAPGAEPDGAWHGWLHIEKVTFYRTSNNTWFITNMADEKYVQVYPDVAGLVCKEK